MLLEDTPNDKIINLMNKTNPKVIPRNHLLEEALNDAIDYSNFDKFFKMLKIIQSPYDQSFNDKRYIYPPSQNEIVHQTFCGT